MNRAFATLPRLRGISRRMQSSIMRARTVRTGPPVRASWRVNPVSGRVELRWLPVYPDPDPLSPR